MLEIVALVLLCTKNSQKAKLRGRSGGWAIGYTILLWLGLETIGFMIGVLSYMGRASYILAVIFAVIGAVTSHYIAKRGTPIKQEPSSFVPYYAPPLSSPCHITLMRDERYASSMVSFTIYLNGTEVGVLKNGSVLHLQTPYFRNEFTAKDMYGIPIKTPYVFEVPDGGVIEIHFEKNKFHHEMTRILQGVIRPPVHNTGSAGPTMQNNQPSQQTSVQENYNKAVQEAAAMNAQQQSPNVSPFVQNLIDSSVADLIDIYSRYSYPDSFLTDSSDGSRVCTIAKKLDEAGGFVLMKQVHERFAQMSPLYAHSLSMHWDGIGGWRH